MDETANAPQRLHRNEKQLLACMQTGILTLRSRHLALPAPERGRHADLAGGMLST
jgi:hypothetical protein